MRVTRASLTTSPRTSTCPTCSAFTCRKIPFFRTCPPGAARGRMNCRTCWPTCMSWWSRKCTGRAATACWSAPARPARRSKPSGSACAASRPTTSRSPRSRCPPCPPMWNPAWRRAMSTCAPTCCAAKLYAPYPAGCAAWPWWKGRWWSTAARAAAPKTHGYWETDMLSRTADHLFWMCRYIERAENTARMLDVNLQMSLLPQDDQAGDTLWSAVLRISELQSGYDARYPAVTPMDVLHYMVREPSNQSSIYACLHAARENARAVRGSLTTEVWETYNATWLELQRHLQDQLPER